MPALLRAARRSYGQSVGASLAAAGLDDVPRNGAFVLGGMANHSGSAGDLIRELGVSKQAGRHLIDTLVIRGYLERQVNPDDRRRQTISVTAWGRAAAGAVRAGVEAIDRSRACRPGLGGGSRRPASRTDRAGDDQEPGRRRGCFG
jgi:hypothetical protein